MNFYVEYCFPGMDTSDYTSLSTSMKSTNIHYGAGASAGRHELKDAQGQYPSQQRKLDRQQQLLGEYKPNGEK